MRRRLHAPHVGRLAIALALLARPVDAAVAVNPNGVNVNSQGATTVFLTYGGLLNQQAAEAFWCGALVPAAPAIGLKCDPATIFGALPLRYNQSQRSGLSGFTDIMSIPASVARRAYQAAEAGDRSSFFYVRRFISTTGGFDEYVVVTCRMGGLGARVPLALVNVTLTSVVDAPVIFVKPGSTPPGVAAHIVYTGTGRLKGRWEVAVPGDEPPSDTDLLTEATLPLEKRGTQRRYTEISRFNVFLPPTGRIVLPGPDPARLPAGADGSYLILFRVEASDDKEGDSDLAVAGVTGIVHAGAVAGFPMPTLRYVVGRSASEPESDDGLRLLGPADDTAVDIARPIDFIWVDVPQAAMYRLEILDAQGAPVHSAWVRPGIGTYRAPSWLPQKAVTGGLRWRVVAVDDEGRVMRASRWHRMQFTAQPHLEEV